MNGYVYKKATGDIIGTRIGVSSTEFDASSEFGFFEVDDPVWTTTLYIKDGVLTQRSEQPSKEHQWNGNAWVLNTAQAAQIARLRRNALLTASDWSDLASAPQRLGGQVYQQWQQYRQALRDITNQPGFPATITWPTPPA